MFGTVDQLNMKWIDIKASLVKFLTCIVLQFTKSLFFLLSAFSTNFLIHMGI